MCSAGGADLRADGVGDTGSEGGAGGAGDAGCVGGANLWADGASCAKTLPLARVCFPILALSVHCYWKQNIEERKRQPVAQRHHMVSDSLSLPRFNGLGSRVVATIGGKVL